jgi:hypothetical protein
VFSIRLAVLQYGTRNCRPFTSQSSLTCLLEHNSRRVVHPPPTHTQLLIVMWLDWRPPGQGIQILLHFVCFYIFAHRVNFFVALLQPLLNRGLIKCSADFKLSLGI